MASTKKKPTAKKATAPAPVEAPAPAKAQSLRVKVTGQNCTWNSRIWAVGSVLTLKHEKQYIGSCMKWLDRPNDTRGLRQFAELAPPNTFRRAMQEVKAGMNVGEEEPKEVVPS